MSWKGDVISIILLIATTFVGHASRAIEADHSTRIRSADLLVPNQLSFDTKLRDMRSAKEQIQIATYIVGKDQSGTQFIAEAVARARAGVKVQLLLDFFMNFRDLDFFEAALKQAGPNLEIRMISPRYDPTLKAGLLAMSECLLKEVESDTEDICGGFVSQVAVALKTILLANFNIDFFQHKDSNLILGAIATRDFSYLSDVILRTVLSQKIQSGVGERRLDRLLLGLLTARTQQPLGRSLSLISDSVLRATAGFHTKILNVDGKIIYVGGRNFEDVYSVDSRITESKNGSASNLFSDIDVRIRVEDENPWKDETFQRYWTQGLDLTTVDKRFSFRRFQDFKRQPSKSFDFSKLKALNLAPANQTTFRIPTSNMRYRIADPTETFSSNSVGAALLQVLEQHCDVLGVSPYLFPPFEIRKALFIRAKNDGCSTELITSSIEGSDFSIVGGLGSAALSPIEAQFSRAGRPPLVQRWGGDRYLHGKLLASQRFLIVTSANFDVRSFRMDTNNLVQFDLEFSSDSEKAQFLSRLKTFLFENGSFVGQVSDSALSNKHLKKFMHDFGLSCQKVSCKVTEQVLKNTYDRVLKQSTIELESEITNSKIDREFNYL